MSSQSSVYENLPPECLLRIIDFLSLPDVAALLQTSRLWNSVINQHESSIFYRIASSLEDYANTPLGSLASALNSWASPVAKRVQNWKQYCRLQVSTKRRWLGNAKPRQWSDFLGPAQRSEAHRLQVDTEEMLLVMTGEEEPGGTASLDVYCLLSVDPISVFSIQNVADLAHVEMSNGFVVFTREEPDLLEVWRWAEDQAREHRGRSPSSEQTEMYEDAMQSMGYEIGSEAHRGELVPMGILKHPGQLRALRLAYPTLCVGSSNGDCVWLWDIRSRELIQTIDIEPSLYPSFNMLYVDVNEAHVFVATQTISVYSRASGNCVFQLEDSEFELFASCLTPPIRVRRPESVFQTYELQPYHAPTRLGHPLTAPYDVVMGVHVSPAGDDFVAITFRGLLFYVSGFRGAAQRELANQSTNSNADTPSSDGFRVSVAQPDSTLENLAYDGSRILVEGTQGLSLFNLESQSEVGYEVLSNDKVTKLYPFPARVLTRTHPFGGAGEAYGTCSSLQLTRDGFWIAWQPDSPATYAGDKRKVVGVMDFAQERDNDSEDGSESDFESDFESSGDLEE